MTLKVVGAGLGRTGTMSLKEALEILLDEPCYHMREVRDRPDDLTTWQRAAEGDLPDWHEFFEGYGAAVDWPMAAFWRPISEAFPDAVILHSTRSDAESWYRSASSTIFQSPQHVDGTPFEEMWQSVAALTFDGSYQDHDVAVAGYERHNAEVIAAAPPERLLAYRPGDGWGPLCDALGLDVPDVPFPHTNTTDEFRSRAGLDS